MKGTFYFEAPISELMPREDALPPKYWIRYDHMMHVFTCLYGEDFLEAFEKMIRCGKIKAIYIDKQSGFPIFCIVNVHLQLEDLFFEFWKEMYGRSFGEDERMEDLLSHDF